MLQITLIQEKEKARYTLKSDHQNVSHLLFRHDFKSDGKIESQICSLNTVHIFSAAIRMELTLKNCVNVILEEIKYQMYGRDGNSLGEDMKQIRETDHE